MYNEADNARPMVERVHQGLAAYTDPWELILVDDGSRDDTSRQLRTVAAELGGHVRVIRLRRNFGQTAAMQAGIDAARGEFVATLDGDLQNDPADIPDMVRELQQRDLDLLVGWRKARQDNLLRRIPSRLANWLIGRTTGVRLHDYGCSLKIYRADVIRQVTLYGEMHRFIPAWVAAVTPPDRIGETVVHHNARVAGKSKYGISRTFRVIIDLLSVIFFMNFRARPAHFFGAIGLAFGIVGGLILLDLAWVKFIGGEDIGNRPLLLVGIVCVIASFQFLTTGILAELLARTYFESSDKRSYLVALDSPEQPPAAWKRDEKAKDATSQSA
ncbi:glycosyltransferase family 2 protein [Ectothiorhodospiraceae bacterium WFHF3C12]|nr:glycosyltransferase family 2 protein [Ectothiorhodospiraceae bacterium WFHF3C12]